MKLSDVTRDRPNSIRNGMSVTRPQAQAWVKLAEQAAKNAEAGAVYETPTPSQE